MIRVSALLLILITCFAAIAESSDCSNARTRSRSAEAAVAKAKADVATAESNLRRCEQKRATTRTYSCDGVKSALTAARDFLRITKESLKVAQKNQKRQCGD